VQKPRSGQVAPSKQRFPLKASFRNIDTSLWLVIARSTDRELGRQFSYLKAENRILRSRLPDRIILTPKEKSRLVRFAKHLGNSLNELATIVHPSTIRRWIRVSAGPQEVFRRKGGRPKTADQIERLVLKMARENGWGYT
jgi:putative transposase